MTIPFDHTAAEFVRATNTKMEEMQRKHWEYVANTRTPVNDPVNRPAHYTAGAIECIEAIHEALGDDGFLAYCRGNAIKYLWRTGKKANAAEDLRKAAWYCTRAAATLEDRDA